MRTEPARKHLEFAFISSLVKILHATVLVSISSLLPTLHATISSLLPLRAYFEPARDMSSPLQSRACYQACTRLIRAHFHFELTTEPAHDNVEVGSISGQLLRFYATISSLPPSRAYYRASTRLSSLLLFGGKYQTCTRVFRTYFGFEPTTEPARDYVQLASISSLLLGLHASTSSLLSSLLCT